MEARIVRFATVGLPNYGDSQPCQILTIAEPIGRARLTCRLLDDDRR
jgi:hypothetical protein